MTENRELQVYVNGQLVPESQAVVSALDRGLRWGDAVYDVERTFAGQVHKLGAHMDRLYRSLLYTRIDPGMTKEEMEKATLEVVEANRPLLGPNDDFLVAQVVTRGLVKPKLRDKATVVIYCQSVPFDEFAQKYGTGVRLVTPATRRTPPECLSPKAKISNKMNHFMAQFEAKQVDPEALALMLDLHGNVVEAEGANFLFVADGCLKIPNRRQVLPGIAMETVLELAENLGIGVEEGDYTAFDVYQADEAFLTATSYCVLPVASLNGLQIGEETPGPVTKALLAAWSETVGMDIVDQAAGVARR